MRMTFIEVRDAGKHSSGPERQSFSKSCGLDIGLFDVDGHVVAEREIQPAEIIWIDIGGEVHFRFAEREPTLRSGPRIAKREAGYAGGGGIVRGRNVEAVQ